MYRIEQAELQHRQRIGEILAELGHRPARWREVVFGTIGRVFGTLCHVSGWFLPMYMAGWLEALNVGQYERAVGYAHDLGHDRYVADLTAMVEEEQRHEWFFATMATTHRLAAIAGRLGPWDPRTVERAAPAIAG